MMKRMYAVLMTLVMCISLVACGGVDKQPAIDAFNNASTAFDDLVNKMNANIDAYPQELIDVMNEMANGMLENKEILESDMELTEEQINEMIAAFAEVEKWAVETDAQLEELAGSGSNEHAVGGEDVYVDMQAAIDRFNAISGMFDATANAVNANVAAFSQEFIDTMVELSGIMSEYKAMLESDYEPSGAEYATMMEDFDIIEQWLLQVESQVFG